MLEGFSCSILDDCKCQLHLSCFRQQMLATHAAWMVFFDVLMHHTPATGEQLEVFFHGINF